MANHLKNEHSPYLQQHANDSVAWYPWGQEALQKARKEQKPIFLSIGYSSCHWCRTMAKESFNDAKTAALLNEHFIAIKVDKEERPDINNYFQAIYKIMNRSVGGWPTSVFLSDTLKPFYTATYIPDEPKYAMMSFSSLLEVIAHKYKHEKATLMTEADSILAQLHPKKESIQATKLDASIIERYIEQAKGLFDNQEGGFSTAPKFPQTSTLELLLTLYRLTQDKEALSMAEQTLTSMAKGGLRDLVDGGFYRYTTDNAWREPHFEKMGYDNALLGALYLQAYHTTQNTFYKRIAFETIDFMLDKMGSDGLFYTASNVGSRAYALLSYDETVEIFQKAAIPATAHQRLLEALHSYKEGDDAGANMLSVDTPQTIEIPYYKEAIKALQASRAKRDYPFIDKKILLSWNAMMTTTLFKASRIEPTYRDTALHALEKLLSTFYLNATLFHTTLEGEKPTVEAFFEDYAYLAQTLLEAHQSTLDEVFLITATQILNSAIEQYYENGRWRFTKGELETYTDIHDSPYPSAVATLLDALHTLSSLVDPVYKKFIFKTLEFYSYDIMRQPIATPKMSQMVIRYLKDDTLIKAKEERLSTHIADLDSVPYPFTLFKGDKNDGFTLSVHNSSVEYQEAFEGVVRALKKI